MSNRKFDVTSVETGFRFAWSVVGLFNRKRVFNGIKKPWLELKRMVNELRKRVDLK